MFPRSRVGIRTHRFRTGVSMESNWLDDVGARLTESTARRMTRRGALKRVLDVAFKGSMVALLGLSNAKRAWAEDCCHPPQGRYCNNCPSGTAAGCPNGMQICKTV